MSKRRAVRINVCVRPRRHISAYFVEYAARVRGDIPPMAQVGEGVSKAGAGRFVAVVCDETSPQVVRRTLEVAGAIRTVGGAAAVGICRGPEFTEMYRWVVRILPEDLERVEVLDTETNERTVCTIADAVGRLMS